ncbi:MAG: BrxE family protein [Chloroflexota bacterium]
MKANETQTIALLRTVIGYLGEKENFAWWMSGFFARGSQAFLAPVFSRTMLLAQCKGVTQAAARIHDERIGVGYVYHLFRLPEDMEQAIHQALHEAELGQAIQEAVKDRETALSALRERAGGKTSEAAGPVRVGPIEGVRDPRAWRKAAAYYLQAFEREQPGEKGPAIFPYFTDLV